MNRAPARNQRNASRILLVLALSACVPLLRAQLIVPVPGSLYTVEGNSESTLPFGITLPFDVRYQQVYDASQFSMLPYGGWYIDLFDSVSNGGWISDVFFRSDGGSAVFSATVSNAEIHLSTTQRKPDGLSLVFSDNIGSDDTLVFSGSFNLNNPCACSPAVFDYNHITLLTNFWYDPRVGNLLMDVRVYQGAGNLIPPLDAVDTLGDSVSHVYADSVTATSGGADTTGLVTFFGIAPVPKVIAYVSDFGTTTNYVAIRWPSVPSGFVLQQSTSAGSNAVWQTLFGVGGTNPVVKEYRIPLNSAGSGSFFRLVRPAGT